ncbi:MAG: S24 family peptidase [Candidatus Eisenbacteria bacterium]
MSTPWSRRAAWCATAESRCLPADCVTTWESRWSGEWRPARRSPRGIEHVEEHLHWDGFGDSDIFAVKVVGESMIEDGILDGDFVIVKPTEVARNNELVVAYLGEDQEATVKRYRRTKNKVELLPANPLYRPIVVHVPDRWFRLAGRVVGIVRRVP